MKEIRAIDYIDPDGLIVRSGELLARQVLETLRHDESVRVQLRGLSGISSSYFNILLKRVIEDMGCDVLHRVQFDFASPLQKQIFDRSWEVIVLQPNLRAASNDKSA
jgi:hypothetical protein